MRLRGRKIRKEGKRKNGKRNDSKKMDSINKHRGGISDAMTFHSKILIFFLKNILHGRTYRARTDRWTVTIFYSDELSHHLERNGEGFGQRLDVSAQMIFADGDDFAEDFQVGV